MVALKEHPDGIALRFPPKIYGNGPDQLLHLVNQSKELLLIRPLYLNQS